MLCSVPGVQQFVYIQYGPNTEYKHAGHWEN